MDRRFLIMASLAVLLLSTHCAGAKDVKLAVSTFPQLPATAQAPTFTCVKAGNGDELTIVPTIERNICTIAPVNSGDFLFSDVAFGVTAAPDGFKFSPLTLRVNFNNLNPDSINLMVVKADPTREAAKLLFDAFGDIRNRQFSITHVMEVSQRARSLIEARLAEIDSGTRDFDAYDVKLLYNYLITVQILFDKMAVQPDVFCMKLVDRLLIVSGEKPRLVTNALGVDADVNKLAAIIRVLPLKSLEAIFEAVKSETATKDQRCKLFDKLQSALLSRSNEIKATIPDSSQVQLESLNKRLAEGVTDCKIREAINMGSTGDTAGLTQRIQAQVEINESVIAGSKPSQLNALIVKNSQLNSILGDLKF